MRYPLTGVLCAGALAFTACDGNNERSGARSSLPPTPCGTVDGRGCAAPSKRVDLARPSFSRSTSITNPLFPISRLRSVVLLGYVEGKPFRTETTLLPGTRTVTWDGERIRVLVSQYMAYLDGRLENASVSIRHMNAAWKTLRAGKQPHRIAERLSKTLAALTRSVRKRALRRTAQEAIDVSQSVFDLELQYRPPVEIDAARFHLWTQQLRVDAAGGDLAGVTGDVAALEWIRDRIVRTLRPAGRKEIDARLGALRAATEARNLPAAADHAARLAARLRTLAA